MGSYHVPFSGYLALGFGSNNQALGYLVHPEDPSTQYLKFLAPKTIKGMVVGTKSQILDAPSSES